MKSKVWKNVPGVVYGEIEILFESSGDYDPGDRDCPPSGCDERTVTDVIITIGNRSVHVFEHIRDYIAGCFPDEIDGEEIDVDPPERDDCDD